MGVPSSGQLRLRADINQEINGNDTDTNVSLGTLSNDAGFTEPDTMSEFYGYSSVVPPTIGSVAYSSNSPDGTIGIRGILNATGGGAVTAYGIKIGTSSNINSATTYQYGTSWGIYSYRYPNATGFSNNTTYHGWIYATNSAGTTNVYAGTVTVPPAYIPVTHSSINPSGDWNYFCPNYNFNGMFRPIFTNSTTSTNIDVYGDGNFSHTDASKPNCLASFGTYQAQSQSRQPACPFSSSTCRVLQTCGNTITGYLKYYISGYTDRIYSYTGQCISC